MRPACGSGCEARTGAVWEFASAATAPAEAESADRRHAGEEPTDGGVNSGAPEPVASAAPRAGGWRGSRACPEAKWQR